MKIDCITSTQDFCYDNTFYQKGHQIYSESWMFNK